MVLPICTVHEIYHKPYFLEIVRMHILYTVLPTGKKNWIGPESIPGSELDCKRFSAFNDGEAGSN